MMAGLFSIARRLSLSTDWRNSASATLFHTRTLEGRFGLQRYLSALLVLVPVNGLPALLILDQ
jgi:hypothetical protein